MSGNTYLTKEQYDGFSEDGYLVISDFISPSAADDLRAEMHQLVDGYNPDENKNLFLATEDQGKVFDKYFRDSSEGIGFFLEAKAVDDAGDLTTEKHLAINKVGHALHRLNALFHQLTFDKRIQGIARDLQFVDPCICQSMYIFKQPKIGGEVHQHQDTSYLWTDPNPKIIGFWVALEDATLENGCLWFAPGSHRDGLLGDRHFFKAPPFAADSPLSYTSPLKRVDESAFKATPVKKGSLVLIDGFVVHRSNPNLSNVSRHIYTWHVVDLNEREWSKRNWLQTKKPFDRLYLD